MDEARSGKNATDTQRECCFQRRSGDKRHRLEFDVIAICNERDLIASNLRCKMMSRSFPNLGGVGIYSGLVSARSLVKKQEPLISSRNLLGFFIRFCTAIGMTAVGNGSKLTMKRTWIQFVTIPTYRI